MGRKLRGLLWVLGILAIVALVLRLTVLDAWVVPNDPRLAASVVPTLAEGDVVLLLTKGSPGFGELVRCTDPEEPEKFVVGRVVGFEGDTVEVDSKSLVVNNQNYRGESACKNHRVVVNNPSSGSEEELNCDIVEMGGGWHYRAFASKPFLETKKREEVGTGRVFIVSDDREYHDDSRDFGSVPTSSCSGRIFFRVVGKEGWSDNESRLTWIH